MNRALLLLAFLGLFFSVQAQKISDLGGAEKVWVLLHPFSAKKAKRLSNQAKAITDSISNTQDWLSINAGGRKDAFRHGIWMSLLSSKIGPRRALWLGKAHEKKNIKDFKKRRLEDGEYPDFWSIEMDLFNNQVGVKLGNSKNVILNEQIDSVLSSIQQGHFKMIKMDEFGNSLRKDNTIIEPDEWQSQWKSDRILVPTF